MIQFEEHMFKMGWNHQVVKVCVVCAENPRIQHLEVFMPVVILYLKFSLKRCGVLLDGPGM